MSIGEIQRNRQVFRIHDDKQLRVMVRESKGIRTRSLICSEKSRKEIIEEIKSLPNGRKSVTQPVIIRTSDTEFCVLAREEDYDLCLGKLKECYYVENNYNNGEFTIPKNYAKSWISKWRTVINEQKPPECTAVLSTGSGQRIPCLAQHPNWALPVFTTKNNLALFNDTNRSFFPVDLGYGPDPVFSWQADTMPFRRTCIVQWEDGEKQEIDLVVHGFLDPEQLHTHIRKHLCYNGSEPACWQQYLKLDPTTFARMQEILKHCPWKRREKECDLSKCSADILADRHKLFKEWITIYTREIKNTFLKAKAIKIVKNPLKKKDTYFICCRIARPGNNFPPLFLTLRGWSYGKVGSRYQVDAKVNSLYFATYRGNRKNKKYKEWPDFVEGPALHSDNITGELLCN